jgi:hypothetical protein
MDPAAPIPPPHDTANDGVTALAALYQGEKTDASNVFTVAMAMMGIAVAYVVGALPSIERLPHDSSAWVMLLLLPAPLWLIVLFHSLITITAMKHGISIRIIEDALFGASKLGARGIPRDMVGSAAGDRVMDISQSRRAHKVTTLVVYGGVGLLVIVFTIHAMCRASLLIDKAKETHPIAIGIAIGGYAGLFLLAVWSWLTGRSLVKEGRAAIPK